MYKRRKRIGKHVPLLLTIGDWIVLNFTIAIIAVILGDFWSLATLWLALMVNCAFIPCSGKLYKMHKRRTITYDRILKKSQRMVLIATFNLMALMFLIMPEASWKYPALFFGLFSVLLDSWSVIARMIIRKARSSGMNYQNVAIVGSGRTARQLIDIIEGDPSFGLRLAGVYDDNLARLQTFVDNGYVSADIISPEDNLDELAKNKEVEKIYFAKDGNNFEELTHVMQIAEEIGAKFVYVPKLPKIMSAQFKFSQVGDMQTLVHDFTPLYSAGNRFLKRALDLAVSVPFTIVSPLIFLPIALGIKLTSPGPVFFRQKRTGLYGEDFTCLKFRTMRVNADSDKVQATKDDPRKTKFGDFLRRTSLDELPQFYNVLMGDMTVVGPRPHMKQQTDEYRKLIDKYMIRLAVKPGITGWAQVNGYRGATEELWQMEKRVEYDVWYISNWSLMLDLKIIFNTFFNQLKGEDNAY